MRITYNKKYVVDACVILAYLDDKEPHHQEAKKFFERVEKFEAKGRDVQILVPAHLLPEVNINIMKKRSEHETDMRDSFKEKIVAPAINWSVYGLTEDFMGKIETEGIYEKFQSKLRAGDFIYAAIAALEKIPLVTIDADFLRVTSEIKVILLTKV